MVVQKREMIEMKNKYILKNEEIKRLSKLLLDVKYFQFSESEIFHFQVHNWDVTFYNFISTTYERPTIETSNFGKIEQAIV